MRARHFSVLTSSLAVIATLSGGCLSYFKTDKDVKNAVATNDYPSLQAMCANKGSLTANSQDDACSAAIGMAQDRGDIAYLKPLCGRVTESFGGRYGAACPALLTLSLAKGDQGELHVLCEHDKYDAACRAVKSQETFGDLTHPDCAKLPQQVVAARSSFLSGDKASADDLAPIMVALAKCGAGAMIFENVADTYGRKALAIAEKQGGDMLGAFQQYLQTHKGPHFLAQDDSDHTARYAATEIAAWLIETKRYDVCKPLASAAAGARESVVSSLADYFVEASCTPASPLALNLLASEDSNIRVIACNTLARIGGPSDLPKITVIANTDTATTVLIDNQSGTAIKTFPVAEACRAAVGKIQLRAS